ncbi:hypothetical protein LL252_12870 [Alcanivorax marinus]|uniref:Uncharacterized protein n=1 Tax=Alloalcanivorax marinus TaxID=1177169 RepID=A0A9Q3UM22_9GAMM|nr:hypothetical protein [Alloalcanivorax marinus]MCC4309462.1 hypothetical protein [Alloalcanivorax marinus]
MNETLSKARPLRPNILQAIQSRPHHQALVELRLDAAAGRPMDAASSTVRGIPSRWDGSTSAWLSAIIEMEKT